MSVDQAMPFWSGLLLGGCGAALLMAGGFALWCRSRLTRRRRTGSEEAVELRSELLRRTLAEQKLRQDFERLSAAAGEFERFVERISQELHTPLQNAEGFAQLLRQRHDVGLPPQADDYLHHLEQSVGQMRGLLEALLMLSQIGREDGGLAAVSLAQAWQAAEGVHAQRIAALHAEIQTCLLPQVAGDPQLLQRLFAQLIDNALKFQPPGQHPRIGLQARRLADDWHITVTDNGIGIPWERLETVFLPLQRLHAREEFGGVGLGLTMCRKIAQRHGGRIWADPHDGGAQIHLVLPALDAGAAAGPADAAP